MTATWAEFKDFLRDQQLDPVNRGINVAVATSDIASTRKDEVGFGVSVSPERISGSGCGA